MTFVHILKQIVMRNMIDTSNFTVPLSLVIINFFFVYFTKSTCNYPRLYQFPLFVTIFTNFIYSEIKMFLQSTWHQYFCDRDLRGLIKQDVIRTFPGVDFFRGEEVQELMINILFAYARENPAMCYRQVRYTCISF